MTRVYFLFCFSPQEFLSDREHGHLKLNAVVVSGELVSSVAAKDKVDAVRVKMNTAREDWKNMMTNLHNRETNLQVSTKTSLLTMGSCKNPQLNN